MNMNIRELMALDPRMTQMQAMRIINAAHPTRPVGFRTVTRWCQKNSAPAWAIQALKNYRGID
jgi:hypothetical protein